MCIKNLKIGFYVSYNYCPTGRGDSHKEKIRKTEASSKLHHPTAALTAFAALETPRSAAAKHAGQRASVAAAEAHDRSQLA